MAPKKTAMSSVACEFSLWYAEEKNICTKTKPVYVLCIHLSHYVDVFVITFSVELELNDDLAKCDRLYIK